MGIRVVVKHAPLILDWPSFVNFQIFKIIKICFMARSFYKKIKTYFIIMPEI